MKLPKESDVTSEAGENDEEAEEGVREETEDRLMEEYTGLRAGKTKPG